MAEAKVASAFLVMFILKQLILQPVSQIILLHLPIGKRKLFTLKTYCTMKRISTLMCILLCTVIYTSFAQKQTIVIHTDLKVGDKVTLQIEEPHAQVVIDGVKEPYANGKQTYTVTKPIITLTGNTYYLSCNSSKVTAIEASNASFLRMLYCRENKLTKLDVSQFPSLLVLECVDNKLTTLDLSPCNELTLVDCGGNDLQSLNLKGIEKLRTLYAYENELTAIDVTTNANLEVIQANDNKISAIDLSQNPKLQIIGMSDNNLTQLDFSFNNDLMEIYCNDNPISALNLSHLTQLAMLGCSDCNLTELDLSQNNQLIGLYCIDNKLTNIKLGNATQLRDLFICQNNIGTKAFNTIAEKLPLRPVKEPGFFVVVNSKEKDEQNKCSTDAVKVATSKHWNTVDYNGDGINLLPYAGYSSNAVRHATKTKLQLYPNPASQFAYLTGAEPYVPIKLLSVEGTVLFETTTSGFGEVAIPVEHLANGQYLVKLPNRILTLLVK